MYMECEGFYRFNLGYEYRCPEFSETIRVDKETGEISMEPFFIYDIRELFPELNLSLPEGENQIGERQKMYIKCGIPEGEVLVSPKEAYNLLRHRTKKDFLDRYLDTPEAYVFYTVGRADSASAPWLVYKYTMECREVLEDVDYGIRFEEITDDTQLTGTIIHRGDKTV